MSLARIPLARIVVVFAFGFCLFSFGRGLSNWIGRYPQPSVQITPPEVDLGVVPVGQAVERVFLIRNVGELRLLITDVRSTCQCTVADLPSRAVTPGTAVQLHVTFKATSAGEKSQRVKIQTNDPSNPVQMIKIQARAVAPAQ